jgi:hypothetical protein
MIRALTRVRWSNGIKSRVGASAGSIIRLNKRRELARIPAKKATESRAQHRSNCPQRECRPAKVGETASSHVHDQSARSAKNPCMGFVGHYFDGDPFTAYYPKGSFNGHFHHAFLSRIEILRGGRSFIAMPFCLCPFDGYPSLPTYLPTYLPSQGYSARHFCHVQ